MTPAAVTNVEELDRGWSWVVLTASFGYFMIFGMFLYGVGIVHLILLEEYDGKPSSTAWTSSIFAALVSLGGPISSIIIDKFSCRTAMFIDGILTTVGCLATAFSPCLALCTVTYGIIAGLGGGIGYTATMVVVGFNFRHVRSLAVGVAISGVGIGTCVLSPIMECLREFYGNVGYFIILAAVGVHKCVFATLCKPSELELTRQKHLHQEQRESISKRQLLTIYAKVYSDKLVVCFSISLMLFSSGTYMIFVHLPAFARSKGYSGMACALLLSACGLTTVLSRLLTNMAANRKDVDEIVLYFCTFGALALGTFLFPLYSKNYAGLLIFSLVLGSYFGGCYAIMNAINTKLVGIKYLSIATSMELLFCGVGIATGPVFTGIIIDTGGSYEHAFMLAAFMILIGAALGMTSVVFHPDADIPEAPDLDQIITKDGASFNKTTSARKNDDENILTNDNDANDAYNEKQNQECNEKHCKCGACSSPANQRKRNKDSLSTQGFNTNSPGANQLRRSKEPATNQMKSNRLALFQARDQEPLNFTEEIQKLLRGEELKFIDDS